MRSFLLPARAVKNKIGEPQPAELMRHNRTGNGSADRRQRQTGRPENLRNCTVCEEVIAETDQREIEEEEREDLGVPQPYNRLIERAEEGRSGEEVPRPRRQLPQGMIAASAEHHRAESTSDHTRQRREPIRPQPVRRSAAQPGAAAAAILRTSCEVF